MCTLLVSGTEAVRTFGLPERDTGPRVTTMPTSAWLSRPLSGVWLPLPLNSRGAEASSISRTAVSEMATGAMTTEALLTVFRGGGGGSLASNCAAPLSPGRKCSSAQFAATKEPPSTTAATISQRKARERPNRRMGAVR